MSGALGLGTGTAPNKASEQMSKALNAERFAAALKEEVKELNAARAARAAAEARLAAAAARAEQLRNDERFSNNFIDAALNIADAAPTEKVGAAAVKGGRRRKQTRRRRPKRAVGKSRKGRKN